MPTPVAIAPRLRSSDGSFSARGQVSGKLLRKIWTSPVAAPAVASATQKLFSAVETPRKPIEFFSKFAAEKVDTINGIIRGVSVITSGVIARGHDLEVDSTTLDQMKSCADTKGQVPVKVDHKSGAAAVCGFLTNFHLDGEKLKADWHLLKTHALKDTILEVAERMPAGVGLSASFLPPKKAEKGKARCEELISVDYVTLPAANPDGMFEAKVDSDQNANPTMTITPEIQAAIDAAVKAATAPLTEQLTAQAKQLELVTNPPSLEALSKMSAEELAELGLTAEDVAEVQAEHDAQAEAGSEGELDADGNPVAAVAASEGAGESGGEGAAGLQADIKAIHEFAAELRAAKAESLDAAEVAEFQALEVKFDALIERNAHLQAQLKTGGKPASHGAGTVAFSTKAGKVINFGTKVAGEFEELVTAAVEGGEKVSVAFSSVIKSNPEAHRDYLVRRGVVKA